MTEQEKRLLVEADWAVGTQYYGEVIGLIHQRHEAEAELRKARARYAVKAGEIHDRLEAINSDIQRTR